MSDWRPVIDSVREKWRCRDDSLTAAAARIKHFRAATRGAAARTVGRWLLLLVALICLEATKAQAVTCDSGAEVTDANLCRFIYHFAPEGTVADPRVRSRLNLRGQDRSRSIALVVGISKYSRIADAQLPPAAVDVANLKRFLKDEQRFDEIIVLENEDADKNNISYFLNDYALPRAALYGRKSRFLFAYTGHGIPPAGGLPASLVLSGAASLSDANNLYYLSLIRTSLENLAAANFHVLALINACYGGAVFSTAPAGGNPDVSYQPGSYALTAGADDQLVYALGKPGNGSIFFDVLIKGISTGEADPYYPVVVKEADVEGGGVDVQRGGVVRLGALATYLTTAIARLNQLRRRGQGDLSAPWIGPVEPATQVAKGGFFFLSRVTTEAKENPWWLRWIPDWVGGAKLEIPVPKVVSYQTIPAPVSSLPGRPDIKIFNAPDDYPIRGIDVSQIDGEIDWGRMAAAPDKIFFAYIKATDRVADTRFEANWSAAGRAGIERGAYHVFRFCDPVDEQFDLIVRTVPTLDDALPIAVDAERYAQPCRGASETEDRRARLFRLVDRLKRHYGKLPLIYGPRAVLGAFSDERPSRYMVWLASYARGAPTGPPDLALAGNNPWTLWQHGARASFDSIAGKVDLNAFFGTAEQFRRFKEGRENAAFAASNAEFRPR
jgi:GH25 family lysozyme M1 (1,4-beta-N-acetylmuramidase)